MSTTKLMAAAGLSPDGVRAALYDLERLGIASNDTVLTAFVHAGVLHPSRQRFEQATALEKAFIEILHEADPDMEKGDTSMLHLRLATQKLKDNGHTYCCQSAKVGHIETREDYCYEECRASSLRVLL